MQEIVTDAKHTPIFCQRDLGLVDLPPFLGRSLEVLLPVFDPLDRPT